MLKYIRRGVSKAVMYCSRLPSKRYSCFPRDVTDPHTKATITYNGVRVATEETDCPIACICLFVEAGPRFETACNNGITHFIQHLAFKGFKSLPKDQLEDLLYCKGIKFTAETHREVQIFSARCPVEEVPCVVGVLANIITNLDTSEAKLDEAKRTICLDMVDKDDDPRQVTFDYLHQTAFQGTSLAQRVIGPSNNISRFNSEFVCQFLCEYYQPYKLCIAASGNLQHEQLLQHVDARFGNLPYDMGSDDVLPSRFTGSQIIYRDDSMPFAHIAIAVEVPGYNSPDFLPLLAAAHMIGKWNKSQAGANWYGGPLARAASAGYLCDSFEAFYIPYSDIGLWGIYFVSKGLEIEDMLYNVQSEWMYMTTLCQYSDTIRGSNAAKTAMACARSGAINSAYDIGYQMMYSCSRRSAYDVFEGLCSVKEHSIKQVMDKYVYDRCPAVAAVGPTEGLPDYSRIRAGMYWLRL